MRILGAALFIGSIILSWTVDPRLDAKHPPLAWLLVSLVMLITGLVLIIRKNKE